jgi:hypothetical protein
MRIVSIRSSTVSEFNMTRPLDPAINITGGQHEAGRQSRLACMKHRPASRWNAVTRLAPLAVWVVVLTLCSMALASSVNDGFAQGELSAYLAHASRLKPAQVSLVKEADLQGKQALRLTGDCSVQFLDIPVKAGARYRLSLRARYQGSESLEENPHFEQFLISGGRSKVVPQRESLFLDADRKRIGGSNTLESMPIRNWFTYRDEFYTPGEAAYLRLSLHSGIPEIVLLVDDVKFEPVDNSQSINLNPVVAQGGLYNYSGWARIAPGGRNLQLDDGRIVFDTKYGSSGKPFPLSQPGRYVVHTRATAAGYSPGIFVAFNSEQGKQLNTIRIGAGQRTTRFELPAGTTHAVISSRSMLIEEIRLVPDTQ